MKQLNKEELFIDDKKIVVFKKDNPEVLLLQPVDERELEEVNKIAEGIFSESPINIIYVAYVIGDWNKELSPWYAPAVFGKYDFKGEGKRTLNFISGTLIPEIKNRYLLNDNIKKIIGGYSLAGLFSLWAVYQTDMFDSVVAASPSVWFEKFLDYTKKNLIRTRNIYLSLGDREEYTKNKMMSSVGDCIRELYAMYKDNQSISSCTLEWNKGNHFVDSDKRIISGYNWTLNR